MFVDESHVTVPQVHGMYGGDRSRKESLVEHGFRLPSALDNRPLTFDEFERHIKQIVYVSATPSTYEMSKSSQIVEMIIRPTGLVDPEVEVRPTRHQVDDLMDEIRKRAGADERVLVTTLTKKMAEDLTDYLLENGIKVRYLHSEVETLERIAILRDLRKGEFDVLVGINLLREGLDLPEVSLVGILDADKEGYLRSGTSLIQTIGRAARNVEGRVIMYADVVTESMARALGETKRRRERQLAFNIEHGIEARSVRKEVRDILALVGAPANGAEAIRAEKLPREVALAMATRSSARCAKPRRTWSSRKRRRCATNSSSCANKSAATRASSSAEKRRKYFSTRCANSSAHNRIKRTLRVRLIRGVWPFGPSRGGVCGCAAIRGGVCATRDPWHLRLRSEPRRRWALRRPRICRSGTCVNGEEAGTSGFVSLFRQPSRERYPRWLCERSARRRGRVNFR